MREKGIADAVHAVITVNHNPVIASDWKYDAEPVDEKVGISYPASDQIALADVLKSVAVFCSLHDTCCLAAI